MSERGRGKSLSGRRWMVLLPLLAAGLLPSGCGGSGKGGGGGPQSAPGTQTSVCGGAVTSKPKLCNLRVRPNPVPSQCPVEISYGISDAEGDIEILCIGFGLAGREPEFACDFVAPGRRLLNEVITVPNVNLGFPAGVNATFELYMLVSDTAENLSNMVTTTFRMTATGSCR